MQEVGVLFRDPSPIGTLTLEILQFLDARSLLQLGRTSRYMSKMCKTPSIWTALAARNFRQGLFVERPLISWTDRDFYRLKGTCSSALVSGGTSILVSTKRHVSVVSKETWEIGATHSIAPSDSGKKGYSPSKFHVRCISAGSRSFCVAWNRYRIHKKRTTFLGLAHVQLRDLRTGGLALPHVEGEILKEKAFSTEVLDVCLNEEDEAIEWITEMKRVRWEYARDVTVATSLPGGSIEWADKLTVFSTQVKLSKNYIAIMSDALRVYESKSLRLVGETACSGTEVMELGRSHVMLWAENVAAVVSIGKDSLR